MSKQLICRVSWLLVMAMIVLGVVPRVEAGFSPSGATAISQYYRFVDLPKIQKTLEMKIISERLRELGFTQDEINAKLSRLNDEQLHQLATNIEDLRVGGDLATIALASIVVGIIIYIIFLFN